MRQCRGWARLGALGRVMLALLGIALMPIGTLAAETSMNAQPIRIGFGMALTGGLAASGKAAVLAIQMWADEVNAKGGLLGRPVQIVYYDDQSNPSTVPGLYTKLLDIDKVDLVLSGYATNPTAAAMPVVIQHGKVFMGLFALAANEQFQYDRYFAVVPSGADPANEFSKGYFEIAMSMQPKPKTVAIVGADAEYSKVATEGARANARKHGLKIVYDRSYPPNAVDFAPIIRAIQAADPDVVFVASYPPDSVGIVRAASEIGFKARMFGGGMIGLQYAAMKQQLGPLLNGIVCFDVYVPEPTMNFPGVKDFLTKYQAKAPAAGVDPLGYYVPPYAYAELQVLQQAVEATGGLDQRKLADYMHKTSFKTVVGDVSFGRDGEPPIPRILFVQYQGIEGNGIDQFKKAGKQVILYPPAYKSGTFRYPYSEIGR